MENMSNRRRACANKNNETEKGETHANKKNDTETKAETKANQRHKKVLGD